MGGGASISVLERFNSKWEKRPSGCWEWTAGGVIAVGHRLPYGRFWVDGKLRMAHRVSWELFRGAIPDGLFVLHHCDNAPCVNPGHLFLGDAKANTEDMISKGRDKAFKVFGERASQAKLTEDDVRRIRRSADPQRILARRYGVTQENISRIKLRKTWRHVEL